MANESKTPAAKKPAAPEPVRILYVDSVLPGNQIRVGRGAVISGSGRIFTRTIEEFEGEFMTPLTQSLLRERKFIVLGGLTDEQRVLYGCDYGPGEVLTGEGLFELLLTCPEDEAVTIFSALCREHRALVCARVLAAREQGRRIGAERIRRFDEIAAADYEDGKSPLAELNAA